MFHCCTFSGRRIETPQAYLAVLPSRYIQVLLAKNYSSDMRPAIFKAAPSVVWRGSTFFPIKGAFDAE